MKNYLNYFKLNKNRANKVFVTPIFGWQQVLIDAMQQQKLENDIKKNNSNNIQIFTDSIINKPFDTIVDSNYNKLLYNIDTTSNKKFNNYFDTIKSL